MCHRCGIMLYIWTLNTEMVNQSIPFSYNFASFLIKKAKENEY